MFRASHNWHWAGHFGQAEPRLFADEGAAGACRGGAAAGIRGTGELGAPRFAGASVTWSRARWLCEAFLKGGELTPQQQYMSVYIYIHTHVYMYMYV